jgi:cyclopropane fatty-acyl-phospholipid synthase-like methyltransferase
MDQCFNRIVSVGMFEHVGVFHYRAFSTRFPAA